MKTFILISGAIFAFIYCIWLISVSLKNKKKHVPEEPKFTPEEQEAVRRYEAGEQHGVSEFIDEDTIIAGYGNLNLDFEYPLPVSYIRKIYGTTSWREYMDKINENNK